MPKCIVVEHDPIIAAELYMMLDDNGYHVAEASGDLDAVNSYIRDKYFDIATLDINFMGETIEPVASELARRGIPLVYIRACPSDDPMLSGLPKGDFLPKPFQEHDLLSVLEKNLPPRAA